MSEKQGFASREIGSDTGFRWRSDSALIVVAESCDCSHNREGVARLAILGAQQQPQRTPCSTSRRRLVTKMPTASSSCLAVCASRQPIGDPFGEPSSGPNIADRHPRVSIGHFF